jgi:glycosyltransferase involved in cell wall biosynthesis
MSSAADARTSSDSPRTRVCIVQQIVPHYRVPVFDLLARQPGIALSVWSGHQPWGSLQPANGGGGYEEKDAPFRQLGPVFWQPGQVQAAKAAVAGRFDVLILSWNSRLVHLPRALRLCRRHRIPTLLWGHGYSKSETPRRRKLRNRLLNLSDACIVYNHTAAKRLMDDGIEPTRVFVALNAIDQARVREARDHWLARPEELRGFQQEKGLAPGATVLFISRLEPDKRVDLLLEAFAALLKRKPTAKLAIIGKGSEEAALRGKAASLGIADRVIFAGSVYQEMNLAPWFLSASCMAYPVAIGLSILHAFGYGLPVVTSDDIPSHNPEIEALRPGENGLLYRDGDVEDFAAKMLVCMDDAVTRERMGQAALDTVRSPDGFCLERMVRGFTDAIDFATKSASRAAAARDASGNAPADAGS